MPMPPPPPHLAGTPGPRDPIRTDVLWRVGPERRAPKTRCIMLAGAGFTAFDMGITVCSIYFLSTSLVTHIKKPGSERI